MRRPATVMNRPQRSRSRGLSLVEILVASAIGIIASLAIFQVFAVFEGQKRTTTSGGEAQTSGTLALFTVEREVRQSGFGMNSVDFLGCAVQGWDQQGGGGGGAAIAPWAFAPIVIAQGTGGTPGVPGTTPTIAGTPDTVTIAYGTGETLPAPVQISVGSLGTTDDFVKVIDTYGFRPGERVVIAESGRPCTMAQVSAVPPDPLVGGDTQKINLQAAAYIDPVTSSLVPTRYNNPAGLGTQYTTNGKVYNLGASTSIKVYSIQNAQLIVQATGAAETPIYDNIAQLQAEYGKDTNADGIIDLFEETPPTNAAQWATVLAVRIALVARSSLYEKEEVSPATIPLWDTSGDAPTTAGMVWNLTADERHYRYKVFQTVVPLRNMIWRP
jgi:type IV pilus assembly protein PilW